MNKGIVNSAVTKKKISDSLKKAYEEGRKKRFAPKHSDYVHKPSCGCVTCDPARHNTQARKDAARRVLAERTAELKSAIGRKGATERMKKEWSASDAMRREGYEVFEPYAVCDRVAVKDGKAYFVEFKYEGQSLRPAQQKVRDAAKEGYIVRFYRD